MNYSIFRFTLNMHNHRSQASVSAFYGDTAVRLLISLTDGGVPFLIGDGCTAFLGGTKADGTKLYNRCVIVNESTIQYDFTEQTTNCVGIINCEVTLYDAEGKVVTAPKFTLVIDEREVNGDDIPVSETEMNIITGIVIAETARAEAEESRVSAETARNTAEQTRISEEKKRASEFASFKKDWDNYNIEVSETAVKKIIATETEGKFAPDFSTVGSTAYLRDGRMIFIESRKNPDYLYRDVTREASAYSVPYRDTNGELSVGDATEDTHATSFKQLKKQAARIDTLASMVKTIEPDIFMVAVKESEKAYSRIAPETSPSELASKTKIAHINSISGDTVKPRKNIFVPTSKDRDPFVLTVSDGGIIHAEHLYYPQNNYEYETFRYPITIPPGTWYVNTHFVSKSDDGVSAYFDGNAVSGTEAKSITTAKPLECEVVIEVNKDIIDKEVLVTYGYYEDGEFIPSGDETIYVCDRYFYVSVSEYPNGVYGEEDNTEGLVHAPVEQVESYNSIVFNPEDLQQGHYRYNKNREVYFGERKFFRSIATYLTEGTYTVACYVYDSATDSYNSPSMRLDALVQGLRMDSDLYDYNYSYDKEGAYEGKTMEFGKNGYKFEVTEACDVKMSFWGDVDYEKLYIVINRGTEPIPITDHKSSTYEIPASILIRCPDYGKKYTYIDFDKKEFVNEGFDLVLQNVTASTFGKSVYSGKYGVFFDAGKAFDALVSTDASGFGHSNNFIYNAYNSAYWVGILNVLGFLEEGELAGDEWGSTPENKEKWTSAIAQLVEYVNKRAEDGNPITFRFKCKNESDIVRTDISDILTDYDDFNEIEVCGGGTVTFVNTPHLPVESTMSFMYPELEV